MVQILNSEGFFVGCFIDYVTSMHRKGGSGRRLEKIA